MGSGVTLNNFYLFLPGIWITYEHMLLSIFTNTKKKYLLYLCPKKMDTDVPQWWLTMLIWGGRNNNTGIFFFVLFCIGEERIWVSADCCGGFQRASPALHSSHWQMISPPLGSGLVLGPERPINKRWWKHHLNLPTVAIIEVLVYLPISGH